MGPYVGRYLTSFGAPTLVLPVASDSLGRPFVPEAAQPAYDQGAASDDVAARSCQAFASWPVTGKHFCFDGRLLHGCPCDSPADHDNSPMDNTTRIDGAVRVTVLANLWIGHQPHRVERLAAQLVAAVRASQHVQHASERACTSSAGDSSDGRHSGDEDGNGLGEHRVALSWCGGDPHAVPPSLYHGGVSDSAQWRQFDLSGPRASGAIGVRHHGLACLIRPDEASCAASSTPFPGHFMRFDGVDVDPCTRTRV